MTDTAASLHDAQFQYVTGQGRPGFATLLPDFEARSAAVAAAAEAGTLDIRYGEAARETFDFFPATGAARGLLVYFHAGYWQSRDKSLFRFIAPAFTAQGLQVALVNYPLCPHVSLGHLLDAARRGLVAVRTHAAAHGGADLPVVVAGHSAGGHIAVELALLESTAPLAGVLALSGVYDLAPLLGTTLNVNLGLDASTAQRYSPLHRVPAQKGVAEGEGGRQQHPQRHHRQRVVDQRQQAPADQRARGCRGRGGVGHGGRGYRPPRQR